MAIDLDELERLAKAAVEAEAEWKRTGAPAADLRATMAYDEHRVAASPDVVLELVARLRAAEAKP